MRNRMRSSGTSSSSATICANAVPMPIPASILPTAALTVPSALTASHDSRRSAGIFAGHGPPAVVAAMPGIGVEKDTTSAPADCRNARRVSPCKLRVEGFIALSYAIVFAARLTARSTLMCAPHRHFRPDRPRRISSSDRSGLPSSIAAAVMIQPLLQ